MNKLLKIKIPTGALLLLSMAAFVMPIVKFSSISISLLDMAGMSSDITDLMDEFGVSSQMISKELDSYLFFFISMFALPVIEVIVLFVVRGKLSFIAGICGVMINNVLAYIFYDKLRDTISLISEAASFFSMDMKTEVVKGTMAFWILICLLVLGLSVFGLLIGESRRNVRGDFPPMKEILPEEINGLQAGPAPNRQPMNRPNPVMREQTVKEPAISSGPSAVSARPFYGGLIGKTGPYKNKVRLFEPEETLLVGTDDKACDVLLNAVFDGVQYCAILYDRKEKEYQLTPYCSGGVFLESGQPLGKKRIYCLPRGTVVMIRDKNNLFQLA